MLAHTLIQVADSRAAPQPVLLPMHTADSEPLALLRAGLEDLGVRGVTVQAPPTPNAVVALPTRSTAVDSQRLRGCVATATVSHQSDVRACPPKGEDVAATVPAGVSVHRTDAGDPDRRDGTIIHAPADGFPVDADAQSAAAHRRLRTDIDAVRAKVSPHHPVPC